MRFLFFTDMHLTGKTPRHRVDDYPQAILTKLREVYSLAKQLGCQFVAFGGDFCKTHRIFSYNIMGDAMDVICDSDLVTYACVGEHDLYGHSPNTYPSSTLAFIERRCSNLKILHDPLEVNGAVLHAKHEWENMTEAIARPVDKAKLNILLCHELITNEYAPFDVIDTKTLTPCSFDLVCSGDLHTGYQPHEVDGTWFCNPGALCRENIGRDLDRTPQVAIIDINKGEVPVIQYRRLECAKPGNDVFGESIAEVVRAMDDFDGDAFTEEMLDLEAESVDVHELIQKAGKAKGLKPEVLDYLASKRGMTKKEDE